MWQRQLDGISSIFREVSTDLKWQNAAESYACTFLVISLLLFCQFSLSFLVALSDECDFRQFERFQKRRIFCFRRKTNFSLSFILILGDFKMQLKAHYLSSIMCEAKISRWKFHRIESSKHLDERFSLYFLLEINKLSVNNCTFSRWFASLNFLIKSKSI